MKITVKLVVPGLLSCASAFADVTDYDISASGEYSFAAGSEYAQLRIKAENKTVTFSQNALTSPVLFSGFSAVTDDKVTFSDVWFDFGQTGVPGPFLGRLDTAHRRQIFFSGSIITNVSSLVLTGYDSGIQNKLTLDSNSSLYAQSISLSDAGWNSRAADFFIRGGSRVTTSGSVYLNAGQVSSSIYWYSGNRLDVSGAGSSLVIGANLGIGAVLADGSKGDASGGSTTGGNTLSVTNGGTVTVSETLMIGGGTATYSNALVVADGGALTVKKLMMDTSDRGKHAFGLSGDRIEVLDGGELNVTGDCQIGYGSTSGNNGFGGGRVFVSNGTFAVGGKFAFAAGSRCTNYVVRVSGPRASFTVGNTAGNGFFSGGNGGRYNSYVFENEVDFTSPYSHYSYDSSPKFCTIDVRTGATFRSPFNHFYVGGSNTPNGNMTNLFSVSSGSSLIAKSFHVVGYGCELAVSNATVDVSGESTADSSWGALYGTLSVGTSNYYYNDYYGKSTNCLLRLSGDAVRIVATNGAVTVRAASAIRYELPATGYAVDRPVVDAHRLHLDEGCALELVGAEDMLAQHAAAGRNGSYVLARATRIDIPLDILAQTRASLPERVTLKVRNLTDGKQILVLGVHSTGMAVIVR